ncbi:XTP/dITP diphosphatase [Psychrobacillus psychrodurans]|jgi:XTP/dITP diphosphohydrolase|uniref:XTP/dITP diphosphatase n=1 Tax=Psychrobacillus psychrodurans TaxID=126157 RepID=UPI0008E89267|nr:XTP/dITP diphosphatase [Psychrobacillus psychrodurans]MCZ8542035.1 XTP/dITP diphosphatase [Psychrobacillus psychrodurans]SFN00117.1 XTP/dITP diphosphohydrolase [Psychrobacillus psychrodurans]
MKQIIIATKNIGKAKDFEALFNPLGYEVKTLHDVAEEMDIEETGSSFEENALIKATSLANHLQTMVIADDSGLEIDALGGRPGIFSARYAGEEKNDDDNIDKVLKELEGIKESEKTARFVCAIAVASPNKEPFTVRGTCEGVIGTERKGTNGFGYDPIFYVPSEQKMMAELTAEQKGAISHRGNAIKKLSLGLKEIISEG